MYSTPTPIGRPPVAKYGNGNGVTSAQTSRHVLARARISLGSSLTSPTSPKTLMASRATASPAATSVTHHQRTPTGPAANATPVNSPDTPNRLGATERAQTGALGVRRSPVPSP